MNSVHGEDECFVAVCAIFNDSQFHVSSHRKNIQALRKLHAKAATTSTGETRFLVAFCHCLHVLLGMKRGDDVSNKLIRFLVGFIVRSADGIAAAPNTGGFVERFVERLMAHALEHVDSKEKLVRARLCQVMVACLNSIQELSDEIWTVFRIKMTERLFDKEAVVRVHAVHSMARLQSLPVGDDSAVTIMDIFLELMQHDPSADVRKAALLQIDVNSRSLPFILERRRDVDTTIRRLFYSKKMEEIDILSLSIHQRDDILKAGLTDRETSVRQACSDMIFENWIQKTNGNLIQFLAGLDVVANTQVAETALKNFFDKLPDMLKGSFTEQFLQSMTAEMAFILRVFCEHNVALCKGDRQIVQDLLPELSTMNQYVRDKYNAIVACSDDATRTELEFVLNELLTVCNMLDFSDEVGRRVMFDTLQEIMSNLEIGDGIFQTCIKTFTDHCSSTSEFLSVMTDFVGGFRDVYEASSQPSGSPLERSLESLQLDGAGDGGDDIPDDIRIMANLKALDIVRSVLSGGEEVSFAKHPILVAYLDEVVIPSVNSPFAAVQAQGLKCLGLCCTIEKALALEYMGLFCDFYRLGHEDGRGTALQVIFDLVFLYGRDYFERQEQQQMDAGDAKRDTGVSVVITAALYDSDETVQSIAAEGFAKLFLHRIIQDEPVLEGLFCLYLHPATAPSSGLKQCLSYFFQAYAFTSMGNQLRIGRLLARVLSSWMRTSRQDTGGMSMSTVMGQLLYLIDRANLLPSAADETTATGDDPYAVMYAQIAVDLSWIVLADPQNESAKTLCGIVTKLPLRALQQSPLLRQLLFLQTQLLKYVSDRMTLNVLRRFSATLLQLDGQDDPLDFDILNEMKAQLVRVLPAGIKAATAAGPAGGVAAKRVKVPAAATANIMDEISDLLDE